jgi:hypothetical protein
MGAVAPEHRTVPQQPACRRVASAAAQLQANRPGAAGSRSPVQALCCLSRSYTGISTTTRLLEEAWGCACGRVESEQMGACGAAALNEGASGGAPCSQSIRVRGGGMEEGRPKPCCVHEHRQIALVWPRACRSLHRAERPESFALGAVAGDSRDSRDFACLLQPQPAPDGYSRRSRRNARGSSLLVAQAAGACSSSARTTTQKKVLLYRRSDAPTAHARFLTCCLCRVMSAVTRCCRSAYSWGR